MEVDMMLRTYVEAQHNGQWTPFSNRLHLSPYFIDQCNQHDVMFLSIYTAHTLCLRSLPSCLSEPHIKYTNLVNTYPKSSSNEVDR